MKTIAKSALAVIVLLAMNSSSHLGAQQDGPIIDTEVKLVDFEDLIYPMVARTAHIQGVVVVRVTLDNQGKVVDAMPISGPPVLVFEASANAKKWRFQPNARKAAVIVYNFRLTDAISKSGCSQFMLLPPNFATITSCVPKIQ